MIGTKVRRSDGAIFTITGQHGGEVVLTPAEFGGPVSETIAGLHDGYRAVSKTALPAGLPPSEQEILRERDARVNCSIQAELDARGTAGGAKPAADEGAADAGPPPGSPEAFFAGLEGGES